jgi:hypothetical protein
MGAYYGHELEAAENENRITKNVYDKTLQVHTAWDLATPMRRPYGSISARV